MIDTDVSFEEVKERFEQTDFTKSNARDTEYIDTDDAFQNVENTIIVHNDGTQFDDHDLRQKEASYDKFVKTVYDSEKKNASEKRSTYRYSTNSEAVEYVKQKYVQLIAKAFDCEYSTVRSWQAWFGGRDVNEDKEQNLLTIDTPADNISVTIAPLKQDGNLREA